jgi:HD-like signal output (HDOD) protein
MGSVTARKQTVLRASLEEAVGALVASGKVAVPLLPQVAGELLQAAQDRNADAARLSALLHRDPALAGQVLRMANSPLYAPRMPIVSLQQAVARLGMAALSEIALAASVESGVFRVAGWEAELRALWREALGTAAFAKEIARLRRLNVETAFLCGLVHDVGRPVVLQAAVDQAKTLGLRAADATIRARLWALLVAHGAATSRRVVEAWKLPTAVVAAVSHHHAPETAGPHVKDAAITAAARQLARHALGGPDAPAADAVHQLPAVALLTLYRDDVEALLGRAEEVRRLVDTMAG